jgi:UDP-N-acetylenolpyruvoylglucosamine reductase
MLSKIKYVLIVIFSIILLYYIINLTSCNPRLKENKEILNKIDSLNKLSNQLKEKQQELDYRDSMFNNAIKDVDFRINNIGKEKIIIREYYNKEKNKIKSYNSIQVDSFFKSRYEY